MNPNTPNPEMLEFIHPKNSPANPASYEGAAPPEELKTQGPTIILHPNAVYLIDPEKASERREKLKEILGGGEEEKPPVLSSLEPSQLPVWASDTEVFWNGSNFTENSKIIWNDGEETTKFISAEKLSTIVRPSTVQVAPPFVLQTYVVENGKKSAKLAFTFIA